MSKLFLLLGLVLIGYGGILAWPLIYASAHFEVARGQILEVFSDPLPNDQVRLSIAYDFPVPSRQKRVTAMGHAQADRSMNRVDAVIIPAAQLAAYEHDLIHVAPFRRVFYSVNDPIGSAFMLTDLGAGTGLGNDQGMLMILAGLVMWCIGFLVRRKRV